MRWAAACAGTRRPSEHEPRARVECGARCAWKNADGVHRNGCMVRGVAAVVASVLRSAAGAASPRKQTHTHAYAHTHQHTNTLTHTHTRTHANTHTHRTGRAEQESSRGSHGKGCRREFSYNSDGVPSMQQQSRRTHILCSAVCFNTPATTHGPKSNFLDCLFRVTELQFILSEGHRASRETVQEHGTLMSGSAEIHHTRNHTRNAT